MRLSRILPTACCLLALAAPWLTRAAQDDQQINAWIATAKDRDADVPKRLEAVNGLGKAGPRAKAAVPALIDALGDSDRMLRSAAGFALGYVRSEPAAAVPALAKALTDPDQFVRSAAANGLAMFGTDARPALPELVKALDDTYGPARGAAGRALARLGPDARPAFAKLLTLLRDPDRFVRADIALAIGYVAEPRAGQPVLAEVVPALAAVFNDEYVEVRKGAALSLGLIPTADSKAALKKLAADDANAEVRLYAQQALERMPRVPEGTPPQPPPERPTEPFATVVKTWATPLPDGFTYHGSLQAGAKAGDRLLFYCWFYYETPPAYPPVQQPNGQPYGAAVTTFTAAAGNLKTDYADLKLDVRAAEFRQNAALEPGTHSVRVYWAVYHEGKKAYLTGADAWRLGAVFTVEKAADGTVRVIPPRGTETTPPPPTSPPKKVVGPVKKEATPPLRYTTFRDPREGAFTAQVPVGWRVQGGTNRPYRLFTTFEVQATSPDGQLTAFLRMNDATKVLATPELAMVGFPEGSRLPTGGIESMPVLRYLPGAKFVTQLILPPRRLGERATETDWPEVARALERFPAFEKVNAGGVKYQFERGGRRYRGGALSVTKIYPFPGNTMALWHCDTLAYFEAPEGREAEAQAALVRLLGSWRVNTTWLNGVSDVIRKGIAIQNEAAAYTAQLISAAYYQRGKVEDRIFQQQSNVTLGVLQLMDPRTGEEYQMDNRHTYYYIRPNGERYGSENAEPMDRLRDAPLVIVGGKE